MKKILKIVALGLSAAGALIAVRAGVELHRILNGEIRLPDGFTYTAHSGCEDTADNSMEFIEKALELGVPRLGSGCQRAQRRYARPAACRNGGRR